MIDDSREAPQLNSEPEVETPDPAPEPEAAAEETAVEDASAEASAEEADEAAEPVATCEAHQQEPLTTDTCSYDDFMKVDMRVCRITRASDVEGADKLLELVLDLGGDVQKTVFAGIKGTYQPEDLVDRLAVCCANLAPRKMRFGISESMVLAAGPGGEDIFLLAPDSGAVPGQRIH